MHAAPTLMNAQLDAGRRGSCASRVEKLGIAVHTEKRTTRDPGAKARFAGSPSPTAPMIDMRHGGRRRRHPAQRRTGRDAPVSPWNAPSSSTTTCARSTTDDIYVGRRMRAAPRPGLRAGRAAVGAGRRAGRPPHRHRHRAAYHGSRIATKLKVAGVDVASMGLQGTRTRGRRVRPVLRTQARRLQDARHPRRQAGRRHAARRHQQGRVPHAGLRPWAAAARGTRLELLFDIGTPAEAVGAAELADDAQVCNCNGVSKGALVACVAGGDEVGRRCDGRDPGRQGLRVVQDAGRPDRGMGRRRRRRGGPVARTSTCRAFPTTSRN